MAPETMRAFQISGRNQGGIYDDAPSGFFESESFAEYTTHRTTLAGVRDALPMIQRGEEHIRKVLVEIR